MLWLHREDNNNHSITVYGWALPQAKEQLHIHFIVSYRCTEKKAARSSFKYTQKSIFLHVTWCVFGEQKPVAQIFGAVCWMGGKCWKLSWFQYPGTCFTEKEQTEAMRLFLQVVEQRDIGRESLSSSSNEIYKKLSRLNNIHLFY